FGRRVRNRRQLNSLQNTWPYGYSMPIAVRYTQDAFSRSGWLWPVDAKGEPLKATSYMAVGFYVAKYVKKYVALWLQYAHRSSLHAGRFFTFWLVVACRSEERRVGKECRSRWWAYH